MLKGGIVPINAIGCQTEIAQKIRERGGDYLLAVKDNPAHWAEALQEFFDEGEVSGFGRLPVSRPETVEKGLGRIETRRASWVTDLSWLEPSIQQRWPKLAGVGRLERVRDLQGKVSRERAFYIGSSEIASAPAFAPAARRHWEIENNPHWVLDVTFREDDCRVRQGQAPQNFSTLRKFALALLRNDTTFPKHSLRGRRKTADRLSGYRALLLGLAPRRLKAIVSGTRQKPRIASISLNIYSF
jgi:predicted transposase YbfD/YdcC